MKTKTRKLPSTTLTAPTNRRSLALARALGRYQAHLDMAADGASSREDPTVVTHEPAAAFSGRTRDFDFHSLAMPVGIQPGFFGARTVLSDFPGSPFRR